MIKLHIAFYLAAGFMMAKCEAAARSGQEDAAQVVTVAMILLAAGFVFDKLQVRKPSC